jgi:dTMP kinase
LQPNLTILMDSDVGASVERARRRNLARSTASSDEGRFEKENRLFFTRVHDAYLEIAKRDRERVVVIDARGTPDQTHAKIVQIVLAKIAGETGSRKTQNAH